MLCLIRQVGGKDGGAADSVRGGRWKEAGIWRPGNEENGAMATGVAMKAGRRGGRRQHAWRMAGASKRTRSSEHIKITLASSASRLEKGAWRNEKNKRVNMASASKQLSVATKASAA